MALESWTVMQREEMIDRVEKLDVMNLFVRRTYIYTYIHTIGYLTSSPPMEALVDLMLAILLQGPLLSGALFYRIHERQGQARFFTQCRSRAG